MTRWDAGQEAVLALAAAASGVVVGAPGTGKTAVLVERVLRLVADGVDPDELVVLTPTRRTATALRDRLALAVDRATSGPLARSVPSFAFQLVRAAEVAAGREPPQLLTGGDEDQIIQDLLEGDALDEREGRMRWPAGLGPEVRATAAFRAEVRAFLADCTDLGIGPTQLGALGARLGIEAWGGLASFLHEYRQVRERLRGAHRDAVGLVREAAELIRAHGAGVRMLLVDDAQELTPGGVELIEACRTAGTAVLAFGDPDIGSGAFRGASPENFARLAQGRPAWVLTGSHRSRATVTDAVRRVTERIGAVGVVAHRRMPEGVPPDGSVRVFVARSAAEEHDLVARVLRERHVHDGVAWSRCAVIAHDTRQVAAWEAELSAREVPARAVGVGRPLGALAPVRDLLRLLELAATDPAAWTADGVAGALSGVCGGLDAIGLRRLRASLRHHALRTAGEGETVPGGAELLAEAMVEPAGFAPLDQREARAAARLATTIASMRDELSRGATVHELLWLAWERRGLERPWREAARGGGALAEQADRDLDAVVALFQSAKRFVERQGEQLQTGHALVFVRGIRDADVAEDRLGFAVHDAVSVLTPATAVGTEYDTVIVAGVQHGIWPNPRLRGSLLHSWRLHPAVTTADAPDVLDRRRQVLHDELRLFVRALSRARARLVVTAVDDDDTGPSAFLELLPAAEPAPAAMGHPLSLGGLVARHRRALTDPAASADERRRAPGQLALLAAAGVPGAAPDSWYGVAEVSTSAPLHDPTVAPVRVSPSRLAALEECELNWVLGALGADAGGVTAGLGTILHAALEHAEHTDEQSLWAVVDQRWGELEFEAGWRERAERTRARDLVRRLALYLRRFEQSGGRLIGAEPHFEVPIALPAAREGGHGAVLSGYIDRVELDGEGRVVIVDLKTGKSEPQTDRAVAENPQLAAYQLAFLTGAIPEVAGLPAGGAKLLVLRPSAAAKDYAEPLQPPFDDERRAAFLARVHAAVDVMCGTAFDAPFEQHCRDDYSFGLCRIHTVRPVSAS